MIPLHHCCRCDVHRDIFNLYIPLNNCYKLCDCVHGLKAKNVFAASHSMTDAETMNKLCIKNLDRESSHGFVFANSYQINQVHCNAAPSALLAQI